jgi:hypothetical protein
MIHWNRLGKREINMRKMVEHYTKMSQLGLNQIIETGTSRIKDNWEGDGQSTLIWDFATSVTGGSVVSIDMCQEAVNIAKSQTSGRVEFICEDSVLALSKIFPDVLQKTSLLYLDSFDWSLELHEASSQHHLDELNKVWDMLPAGVLIVVDDCHNDREGKHVKVQQFMEERFISPFFTGYQVGWLKPKL